MPANKVLTHSYMNWSGGKDSSLCLHRVMEDPGYSVGALLTSVNAFHNRVSMHGVRRELLEAQAAAIGVPLYTVELGEEPGMDEYERVMSEKVSLLKNKGFTHALFGDIFLEDLRHYREEKLKTLGIHCVFPLWKISSRELMEEFLKKGFKAIVVCVNSAFLDVSFCGRLIDRSFVEDLPDEVDPCGENGEYHSFVFEGPLFKYPIPFQKGEIVYKEYKAPEGNSPAGFYFCDLLIPTF